MPELASPPSAPAPAAPRWRRWLEPAIGVVLFAVAALVLHREVEQVEYADIVVALRALPLRSELAALGLVAANYLVMTGFDLLAFVYIGKRVAAWRIMTASFVAYSISNNVGFTLLSGTSARFRFYSRWGLSPGDLSRVVVFNTGTYWVGLLLLGGWVLAFDPHPALAGGGRGAMLQAVGFGLLVAVAAYVAAPFVRREPVRIRRFLLPIPPPRLVLGQFVLSATDWVLAASIFYTLLPAGGPGFGQVLGAFLAAQILAQVSHVPGGLGVFEGSMLLLLGAQVPTDTLLGSLILFRIAYYLMPLVLAVLVMLGDEVRQRRLQAKKRRGGTFGGLTYEVVPKLMAMLLFLGGAALLFSGVRPIDPARLAWLTTWLPLGVVEVAHVAAAVAGAALLVVAHGVAHRLRVAYRLTMGLLVGGIGASLLRAGEFEEAAFLAALLVVLAATRHHFDRARPFWKTRFGGGWHLGTAMVLAVSVWMGLLAYRHTGFPASLWWHVDAAGDAARFLRGSAAAFATLLLLGAVRLAHRRQAEAPAPSAAELAEAERLLDAAGLDRPRGIAGHALLWSRARDALLVYAVRGQSWIALGEPVGPSDRHPELVRSFVEQADDFNRRPVFFGVSADRLDLYREFGLTCVGLGAEARALLDGEASFSGERYIAYPGGLPFEAVIDDVRALARAPEAAGRTT